MVSLSHSPPIWFSTRNIVSTSHTHRFFNRGDTQLAGRFQLLLRRHSPFSLSRLPRFSLGLRWSCFLENPVIRFLLLSSRLFRATKVSIQPAYALAVPQEARSVVLSNPGNVSTIPCWKIFLMNCTRPPTDEISSYPSKFVERV
jgi:hypothetical protein